MVWLGYKGKYLAKEFLSDFPDDRQKFLALATQMGDHGRIYNEKKFRQLKGKYNALSEFKTPLCRIFCVRRAKTYYILTAARKTNDKAQVGDFKQAMTVLEYLIPLLNNG